MTTKILIEHNMLRVFAELESLQLGEEFFPDDLFAVFEAVCWRLPEDQRYALFQRIDAEYERAQGYKSLEFHPEDAVIENANDESPRLY